MQEYFDSDYLLPVLFTVCKEFHSEFDKQYSISFPRMVHGPRLYFNPLVDNVVITRRTTRANGVFTDSEEEGNPLTYPGGDALQ
jgi:hypothetical protein